MPYCPQVATRTLPGLIDRGLHQLKHRTIVRIAFVLVHLLATGALFWLVGW